MCLTSGILHRLLILRIYFSVPGWNRVYLRISTKKYAIIAIKIIINKMRFCPTPEVVSRLANTKLSKPSVSALKLALLFSFVIFGSPDSDSQNMRSRYLEFLQSPASLFANIDRQPLVSIEQLVTPVLPILTATPGITDSFLKRKPIGDSSTTRSCQGTPSYASI